MRFSRKMENEGYDEGKIVVTIIDRNGLSK